MTRPPDRPADAPTPARPGDVVRNPLGYGRETVESIVIAFTLALLFRAFEAEAFVIPTGSMAPTLMGRHKDLVCEECGRDFRVGCSAEEDDQSQSLRAELSRLEAELAALKANENDAALGLQQREETRRRIETLESDRGSIAQLRSRLAGKLVPAAKCPNCGYGTRLVQGVGGRLRYDPRYPSFSGDRILVNKFAYDFTEPKRWDVVVFKYPEEAKTNYIKRLVGLPGETVSIAGGDIWTSRGDAAPAIVRKPADTLRAMLQCVHDSRYVSAQLEKAGWPMCWTDWSPRRRGEAGRWTTADAGRSFSVSGRAAEEPATLRYRHFLPAAEDWEAARKGESLAEHAKPSLVDDFQPYNAIATRSHWVGDLGLEMECATTGQDGGSLAIDLVEAGAAHRCTFDLATGEATLSIAGSDLDAAPPRARTPVRGTGSWQILFANVDDELSLFVDGRRIAFDRPTAWARSIGAAVRDRPTPGPDEPSDLAPVGITVARADVRVSSLRVLRDTYYIGAIDVGNRPGEILEEDRLEFPLAADQFFVLGDNSAASKDSRLWLECHHVDRGLLIGKAVAIFWPHAVPASWSVPVSIGGMELRLPSWPNFGRMRFVR
ncbi:MAG: signal peptidase I [Planctomycetia bacterium]